MCHNMMFNMLNTSGSSVIYNKAQSSENVCTATVLLFDILQDLLH